MFSKEYRGEKKINTLFASVGAGLTVLRLTVSTILISVSYGPRLQAEGVLKTSGTSSQYKALGRQITCMYLYAMFTWYVYFSHRKKTKADPTFVKDLLIVNTSSGEWIVSLSLINRITIYWMYFWKIDVMSDVLDCEFQWICSVMLKKGIPKSKKLITKSRKRKFEARQICIF